MPRKGSALNRISNLPLLQVWISSAALCQGKPRNEAFSVDRVRRDGLSTPNHCGFVTSVDEPGTFTVFVKPSKKLLFPKLPNPVASEGVVQPEVAVKGPGEASGPVSASALPVQPAVAAGAVAPATAPATVAPGAATVAKAATHPENIQPVPPSGPAPAIAPAATSAPEAAPLAAQVAEPVATPVIQTLAPPPPAAALPVSQPAPSALQVEPRGAANGSQASAPRASRCRRVKHPAPIKAEVSAWGPFASSVGRQICAHLQGLQILGFQKGCRGGAAGGEEKGCSTCCDQAGCSCAACSKDPCQPPSRASGAAFHFSRRAPTAQGGHGTPTCKRT